MMIGVEVLERLLVNRSIRAFSLILIIMAAAFIGSKVNKEVFAPAARELPIYSVETKEKKMAITFDVNWGDDKTEEILSILKEYNVKATFYIIGLWCDDYPERVKEIYDGGHEIGNHSNRHTDYTTMSRDSIIKDIEVANAKIMAITGEIPKTFRFPSGSYNDMAVKAARETGMELIQWDADSVDWKAQGEDIEYKRIVSKAREGSIMLFHNDGKYTPANLRKIIQKYQQDGYEFVTVSEMTYKGSYYLDHTGRQIRN